MERKTDYWQTVPPRRTRGAPASHASALRRGGHTQKAARPPPARERRRVRAPAAANAALRRRRQLPARPRRRRAMLASMRRWWKLDPIPLLSTGVALIGACAVCEREAGGRREGGGWLASAAAAAARRTRARARGEAGAPLGKRDGGRARAVRRLARRHCARGPPWGRSIRTVRAGAHFPALVSLPARPARTFAAASAARRLRCPPCPCARHVQWRSSTPQAAPSGTGRVSRGGCAGAGRRRGARAGGESCGRPGPNLFGCARAFWAAPSSITPHPTTTDAWNASRRGQVCRVRPCAPRCGTAGAPG